MQKEMIQGFRLSPQQKRLWSLQRHSDNHLYRAQCSVLIHGPLDSAGLRTAVRKVVKQHEILRTSFCFLPGMTIPLQVIGESDQFHFTQYEWSGLTADEKAAGVEEVWEEARQTPFTLERDGQLHVWLLKLGEEENVLVLSLHAMCADAAGLRHLLAEISRGYGAGSDSAAALADQTMQYADVSEWQNELLESEDREGRRTYWLTQDILSLANSKLPYRREATAPLSPAPQIVIRTLNSDTVRTIEALADRYETSASVVLLTCWHVLLGRITTRTSTLIGTAVDGRKYKELETTPGLLTRYLPVICHQEEGARFSDLLQQLQTTLHKACIRQDSFTWEYLKDAVPDQAEEPYSSFGFDYEEQPNVYSAGGVHFTVSKQYVCTERFDLRLSCARTKEILTTEFHYDSRLYTRAHISLLAEEFLTLVDSVIEHERAPVRELEIVGAAERRQLLVGWNDTATAYPAQGSVPELFERQATKTANAVAVVYEDEQLTFAELNRRANQLAHHLRSCGVGAEVRVALCLERSPEMVVALLAVLKAGGVYVPLDPGYPRERLRLMLEDSGAAVLLTQQGLLALLPEHEGQIVCLDSQGEEIAQQSVDNPDAKVPEENLAYIIYTSGSSGRPKGVCVTHRNLFHSTCARFAFYPDAPARFLLLSSLAFDSSVAGIFWTLCGGGALVLPAEGLQRDALGLVQLIGRQRVSHLLSLPALHGLMLEVAEAGELESLRVVIVAGEACAPELVQRHQASLPETALYNEYGPTEATVWSSVYQCVEGKDSEVELQWVVPIGRPIANTKLYILDEEWRPVPIGLSGEMYIGGLGITRGYLHRSELTAERFIPDPFSSEAGARLYQTGDLARYLADGQIEFLGRTDSQLKIRGFRIELGEIEAVLSEEEAVKEAVVMARGKSNGGQRLVAYLTLDQQKARTAWQLLRWQGEGLPNLSGSQGLPAYQLPNGLTIIRHNKNEADYLYQEIFEEQAYFAPQIKLRAGACVFDVGANIGLFSLFVAHVCDGARIYAFEPMPEIFKLLGANAELYGLQAKLFECGLADQAGSASFSYYPHLSLMSGRYADAAEAQAAVKSFEQNLRRRNGGTMAPGEAALAELLTERLESRPVECRLRTISEVMRTEGVERIDLLKIDVEKSELGVLQGVEVEDWEKIRQVVVRLEDREGRLAEVSGLLTRAGYEVGVAQDEGLQNSRLYKVYAVRAGTTAAAISSVAKGAAYDAEREWLRPAIRSSWRSPEQVLEAVRRAALERLPEYMIPEAMVLLAELPLMANGKLDRQALPAPEQVAAEGELSPARTPVEEVLAGIWAEVLGVGKLSVTANFFELGGHSLLATQVMSRVRRAFNIELPVRSLFATPTVRGLAEAVAQELSERQGQAAPPLKAMNRAGQLPLSYAQQRLWFADQLRPDTALYNVPVAVRLSGPLNIAALEQTLTEIIRRHEVLRTTFPAKHGEPMQVIATAVNFSLPVSDLSGVEAEERESVARRLAEEEAARPFDLAAGPLLRASLLRLGDEEHIALFTMHHIVSDGWSMSVLINEVSVLYEAYSRGEGSPLRELPIQYADYAVWQREWLQGDVLAEQLNYWREQLRGVPEALELPTDKPRPAVQTHRGAHHAFSFTPELSDQLKAWSRRQSATLFMTLLAAFTALLHYYSGQEDIVVGIDVANRNGVEVEGLIGFLINILVTRIKVSGNPTFRQLLMTVRETMLGAYAHQELPFERLVEELRPERSLSGMPLIQSMFSFHNTPPAELRLPDLTVNPLELDSSAAKRELTLFMSETEQGLAGTWTYNSDLFTAASIKRLSDHFEKLMKIVIAQPDERLQDMLKVLAEADREQAAIDKKDRRASKLKQFMSVPPKAVDLSEANFISTGHLTPEDRMPLVVRPCLDDVDLLEWAKSQQPFIKARLLEYGAILFRGFSTRTAREFEQFALSICPDLFGEYGDLPREGVSGNVYGSTPYPADQAILFHNESSHLHRWPLKIWFFCLQAAQQGGETPIVDCRKVYELLNPKLRERFAKRKLMYVRNYTKGLDVSWQEFFRTSDKAAVENYCRQASIAFGWTRGDGLRTRQVCHAVVQPAYPGKQPEPRAAAARRAVAAA